MYEKSRTSCRGPGAEEIVGHCEAQWHFLFRRIIGGFNSLKRKKWMKKRLKNWVVYGVVKIFVQLLQNLPRSLCFPVLTTIGCMAFYLVPGARNRTIRHLFQVFGKEMSPGEIRRTAKEVFRNLGRNAVDVLRMKQTLENNPDRWITCVGLEHLNGALTRGKGVILIGGHLGAWELLGGYIAKKGYPLSAIATPLDDPRLDKLLVSNRTAAGVRNIVRSFGARQVLKALRKAEVVGIVMDQDTRVDGVFVDFLGTLAYTPVAPAVLAMKTGAPVLPATIHMESNNRHVIEIGEPIEMEITADRQRDRVVNTLRCSKAIERSILQYPAQWAWMHRRWRTRPENHRTKVIPESSGFSIPFIPVPAKERLAAGGP